MFESCFAVQSMGEAECRAAVPLRASRDEVRPWAYHRGHVTVPGRRRL